ncbi:hypothetical protein JNUCC1_03724 [Lentibacillus sp. JNUCC-1]|uniref:hypothetical protein n=1 Tax=Lentibacillus sp. JNUCC-1 TaxID=2654513 RepID=UPI00132375AE|nr:hypothetical protein [Lentibacillus sp. JNUCC-1]MUV39840.1 hypothetical protein [Lentibacillus sp. JNUCC-1]
MVAHDPINPAGVTKHLEEQVSAQLEMMATPADIDLIERKTTLLEHILAHYTLTS